MSERLLELDGLLRSMPRSSRGLVGEVGGGSYFCAFGDFTVEDGRDADATREAGEGAALGAGGGAARGSAGGGSWAMSHLFSSAKLMRQLASSSSSSNSLTIVLSGT